MLLDTSGLLCYFDADEARHQSAQTYFDAAIRRVTHSYILAEFVALAQARKFPRQATLDYLADLTEHPDIEVVWVDERLHQDGMSFLKKRLDKTYSLCDAVSFLVMQRLSVTEALTTDAHFEQAGFRRLLL
jgi:predicted nucleic acid-binding protein